MRRWMWPAVVAVLLFAGNLAANWVGTGTAMEVFIDQYWPWLWAIIALSLLLTVGLAIYDARQSANTSTTHQSMVISDSHLEKVNALQSGEGEKSIKVKGGDLKGVDLRQE